MAVQHQSRTRSVNTGTIGAMVVAMFASGCGSPPPAQTSTAHHHHVESMKGAPMNPTERFRPLIIPPAVDAGDDVQVTKLLDEPHAKILCIRLRHGAEFPAHDAPVPVIIQAASGAGMVLMDNERLHIDGGQFVTLAPHVKHSVLPDPGSELVLIVTQIRR